MTRKSIITAVSALALVVGAQVPGIPAFGQQASGKVTQDAGAPAARVLAPPMVGAIAGVVKSTAEVPIVGAMVTAARADGTGIWTTISGSEGIFSIPNVAPGEYLVTLQADGYPEATVSKLQIVAGRATRTDVMMAGGVSNPPSVSSANASTPGASAGASGIAPASSSPDRPKQSLLARLSASTRSHGPQR